MREGGKRGGNSSRTNRDLNQDESNTNKSTLWYRASPGEFEAGLVPSETDPEVPERGRPIAIVLSNLH